MCNLISLFFTSETAISETAISETAISETAISGANITKFRLCKENDKKMLIIATACRHEGENLEKCKYRWLFALEKCKKLPIFALEKCKFVLALAFI